VAERVQLEVGRAAADGDSLPRQPAGDGKDEDAEDGRRPRERLPMEAHVVLGLIGLGKDFCLGPNTYGRKMSKISQH